MATVSPFNDFNRRFLIQLGTILGIILVAALVLYWLSRDISSRAANIQAQRQQIATRTMSLESLAELKSQSEQARSYSSVLANILPLKDQLISFPRDIQDIAKRYGVDFGSSFTKEEASTEVAPGSIGFIFTIGGNYDKVLNFLRDVEGGRYIVKWDSIDLSEKAGFYKGTISGRVYSR